MKIFYNLLNQSSKLSFLLNLILFLQSLISSYSTREIYIAPDKTICDIANCNGDLATPYHSLANAFAASVDPTDNVRFILIGRSDNGAINPNHFFFLAENDSFYFTDGETFWNQINGDIILQPYYCDDAYLIPANPNICIDRTYNITIYLKTDKFTLNIVKSLTISNIIFDGSQDLEKFDSNNTCLSTRAICDLSSSAISKTSFKIYSTQISQQGIFKLNSNNGIIPSFTLKNTKFTYITSNNQKCLISMDDSKSNIIIQYSEFSYNLFYYGHICYIPSNQNSTSEYDLNINIKSSTFNNYNPYSFTLDDGSSFSRSGIVGYTLKEEGYVFYSSSTYTGNFILRESIISRMWPLSWSTTSNCPIADNGFSVKFKPFTSDLNSIPSGLDITTPYSHNDYDLAGCAAVQIKKFNGSFEFISNTISDVIGASGAVIAIKDLEDTSTFDISYNKFENNYAIISFSTIKISQLVNSYFKQVSCQGIKLFNNTFLNNRGCPGSYGNVIFLCGETQAKNLVSTQNYDPFSYQDNEQLFQGGPGNPISQSSKYSSRYGIDSINFINWQSTMKSYNSDTKKHLIISQNHFEGNLAVYSNSIAVFGYTLVLINNNTFLNNGVTLGAYGITTTYTYEKNPNIKFTTIYFTQTSAAMIQLCTWVNITNNTFNGNWAVLIKNTYFGSSLTIDRMILLSTNSTMTSNIFKNHVGVPKSIISQFNYTNANYVNYFQPPIMTFGVSAFTQNGTYITGSYTNSSFTISELQVIDNEAYFDQDNYLVQSSFKSVAGFMIRFYFNSELKPSLAFIAYPPLLKFKNSIFNNNSIKNGNSVFVKGISESQCMLSAETSFLIQVYDNITFTNNRIFVGYIVPFDIMKLNSIPINSNQKVQAYICPSFTAIQTLQLNISNSKFKNNTGTIITGYNSVAIQNYNTNINPKFYVNNISVSDHKSNDATLFINYQTSIFINSSIFTSIYTLFGIVYSQKGKYEGINNTYMYINGFYAALGFFANEFGGSVNLTKESNSVISHSTITPQEYFFSNQETPSGGLYYIPSSATNFIVDNVIFYNNTIYAGIHIIIEGKLWDYNSVYLNNTSRGTALYATVTNYGELIGIGINFTNNQYNYSSSMDVKLDGLINCYSSTITLINSSFINNAILVGSLMTLSSSSSLTLKNATIYNTFHLDTTDSLIKLYFSTLVFDNVTLYNNTKLLKMVNTTFNIEATQFLYNLPVSIDKKVIEATFSNGFINNSKFIDSGKSQQTGYFLFAYNFDYITLINSTFKDFISNQGNLISIQQGLITIKNCTFSNNSFVKSGSAFYGNSLIGNISIIDSTFSGTSNIISHISVLSSNYWIFINNTIFYGMKSTPSISMLEISYISFYNVTMSDQLTDDAINNPSSYSIYISSCTSFTIDSSSFIGLVNKNGVLNIVQSLSLSNIYIKNSQFINNTGLFGGSVQFVLSGAKNYININNCTFSNNTAKNVTSTINSGSGGVFYYQCVNGTDVICNFTISNSTFIKNSADLQGGIIHSTYFLPYFDSDVYFINNTAPYGPITSAYGIKLIRYTGSNQDTYNPNWADTIGYTFPATTSRALTGSTSSSSNDIIISNIGSGIDTTTNFTQFALVDVYGQIVKSDNSSTLKLTATCNKIDSKSFKASATSFTAVLGIYTLASDSSSTFQMSYDSNKNCTISLSSSGVYYLPPTISSNYKVSNAISVIVTFRNCTYGETYSSDSGKCTACAKGTYLINQIENYVGDCKKCSTDKALCFGGTSIGPKNGYFRLNTSGDILYPCPFSDACIGNNDSISVENLTALTICKAGYHGNACYNCDTGSAKYGSSDECLSCNDNALYYIQLFGMIILQMFILAYSVKCTLADSKSITENEAEDPDIAKSNLVKIMVNYSQVLSIISSFPFQWPSSLTSMSSYSSKLNVGSTAFSFDCFLQQNPLGTKLIWTKLTISFASPFILMILALGFWITWYKYKKRPLNLDNKDLLNTMIATIVVIIFNLQPNLITSAFKIFQCENLYRDDQAVYFMSNDFDIQCWANLHLLWAIGLGLTNILTWAIFIPLALYFILRKNKDRLNEDEVRNKYSFLYKGYKKHIFWWEFIVMFRKYSLIVVLVFVIQVSSILQGLIVNVIIFVSLYVHMEKMPFENNKLNQIEKYSLLSLLFLDIGGVYFLTITEGGWIDYPVILITIIFNCYFFWCWTRLFLSYWWQGFKKTKIGIAMANRFKIVDQPVFYPQDKNNNNNNFRKIVPIVDNQNEILKVKSFNDEESADVTPKSICRSKFFSPQGDLSNREAIMVDNDLTEKTIANPVHSLTTLTIKTNKKIVKKR